MKARTSKGLDFAHDLFKQILTLSTAIVGGSIIFLADVAREVSRSTKWWLYAAWVAFGLSIIFGLMALSTLTNLLTHDKEGRREKDGVTVREGLHAQDIAWHSDVVRRGRLQILLFLVGLALLAVFGVLAI